MVSCFDGVKFPNYSRASPISVASYKVDPCLTCSSLITKLIMYFCFLNSWRYGGNTCSPNSYLSKSGWILKIHLYWIKYLIWNLNCIISFSGEYRSSTVFWAILLTSQCGRIITIDAVVSEHKLSKHKLAWKHVYQNSQKNIIQICIRKYKNMYEKIIE